MNIICNKKIDLLKISNDISNNSNINVMKQIQQIIYRSTFQKLEFYDKQTTKRMCKYTNKIHIVNYCKSNFKLWR